MLAYIIKRLLLIVPTLFGIMLISFVIIQFAPGGPVERMIAQLTGSDTGGGIGGRASDFGGAAPSQISGGADATKYQGARGLDPAFIKQLEKQFGFDKPAYERFYIMIKNYLVFDFGRSYFRDTSVISLIREKLPVSISLGLWMTLLTYMISIPLGIRKAVQDGSRFDVWSSTAVAIGYAIPGFLFAVLLIVLFAGGSFVQWFPLRGLTSSTWLELPHFLKQLYPNADQSAPVWQWLPWYWRVLDYFWHLALPLIAMSLGAFATTSLLTKNAFLDEIRKQYVTTARSKGLTESKVLYGHVFRNAMLLVIAGFPAAFIHAFFGASILIETIFSLDGLGLLGYEAVRSRDYPVVFGTLYIFSLLGLVVNLVSDLVYTWVDPRIDFETREV